MERVENVGRSYICLKSNGGFNYINLKMFDNAQTHSGFVRYYYKWKDVRALLVIMVRIKSEIFYF